MITPETLTQGTKSYLMLEDSAEALLVTVVATFDSLWVNSCFLAAAIDTNDSSLFDDVGALTGVPPPVGVEHVGCDVIFGSPGTNSGRGERMALSWLMSISSSVSVTLDVAASRIVRKNVTRCSSCDLLKNYFYIVH